MTNPASDFNPMLDDAAGPSSAELLGRFDDEAFFPLTAPGMPPPGPDFCEHAQELGDDRPQVAGTKDTKRLVSHGPVLEKLYRTALYNPHCSMPVKLKGRAHWTRVLPGHRWGQQVPAGPDAGCQGSVNVMLVGKCLGQNETNTGRNFCGPSGQLMREVLSDCGAERWEQDSWYVTNLVRHENFDPAGSKLPARWVANCAILLEQELRLARPKLVLCLGSEAARHLLRDEPGGVQSSAGRVFKRRVRLNRRDDEPERWHEYQLMVAVHPAAVLRYPAKKPELRGTALRFVQLLRGELREESELERPDHRVIWNVEELTQVVDDVIAEHKASGRPALKIALDCEWNGAYWTSCDRPLTSVPAGDVYVKQHGSPVVDPGKGEKESWLRTVQFSVKPGWARTVVLRHGGRRSHDGIDRVGTPAFVPSIASAVTQLGRLFTPEPGKQVRLIGHHLRADLPWLYALDPELGSVLIDLFDAAPTLAENRHKGGFDTLYAMHAIEETSERKLELVGMNVCGVRRYDAEVIKDREAICAHYKLRKKKLPGYAEITDEILHPYGNWDADTTIRIEEAFTRAGGLLDRDRYGNSSWEAFWRSQQKLTAELEMEMTGLLVDHGRAEQLLHVYEAAGKELLAKLRGLIGWADFNPNSVFHVRCVLFNPWLAGKIDNANGNRLDPRPADAMDCKVLGLTPVKTSGKPPKDWAKVVARKQADQFSPSCDKEVLGILLAQALAADNKEAAEIVRTLRHYRFINRVLTGVLCPQESDEPQYDEDGDLVFDKGFMSSVEWDYRVRTHFLPVDTGRVSSSGPNIQNFSKRREADLKKILGEKYLYPLRSIITAPGRGSHQPRIWSAAERRWLELEDDEWFLVESDFTGAELMMMAIQSGSAKMVDHCQRANLKDGDPRQYDIHSTLAVQAFQLTVTDFVPRDKDRNPDGLTASQLLGLPVGARLPALKHALWCIGKDYVRDIAKTIVFGVPYGRGDDAVVRAVEELGVKVTPEDVAKIRGVIFDNYPEPAVFFPACQARVRQPGWLRSCKGRYRRFEDPGDMDDVLAEMERQAGNFLIQSGISDVTTESLFNFRHMPGRYDGRGYPRYLLVAQIHDAVMSMVRARDLEWYVREVVPRCMDGVEIHACDLDGKRLPGRPAYHLGHETAIYKHWGSKLSYDQAAELGVPKSLLPKAPAKKGG